MSLASSGLWPERRNIKCRAIGFGRPHKRLEEAWPGGLKALTVKRQQCTGKDI
nr:MAG TPA: hypothetical protein [Caudoviricetes sp.]